MLAFVLHVLLVQVIVMAGRVTLSYRAIEIGASALWIGLVGAAFSLLPLLLSTAAGRRVDASGARGAFLAGSLCLLLAAGGLVLRGDTVAVLLACSMLLGLGHVLCMLAQHAFMAGTGGTDGMDGRFAHYTAIVSLGQMIGPLFVALFGGAQSIPDTAGLFLFVAGLALANLVASLAIPAERPAPRSRAEPALATTELLRLPGVATSVLAGLVVVCVVDLTVVYMPVLGASARLPAGVVAGLLTFRALVSLISRLAITPAIRLVGRDALIVVSVGMTGAGLAMLGLPLPLEGFVAAMVLVGVGVGLAVPLTMSSLSGIVPPRSRGLALSLRLTGNRLAQFAVPASVGAFAGTISLPVAFVALGVVVVGVAGHTHRATRRRLPPAG